MKAERARRSGALAGLGFGLVVGMHAGAAPPVSELGLLPGDLTVEGAVDSQQDQAAARGGNQTLVVWSDYRARSSGSQTAQGDGDILGIRLDSNGVPVESAPFLIASGMGLQRTPLVAWDGQDWLVVYLSQEPVGGYYGDLIRAVRVSGAGQVLDATPLTLPAEAFTPDWIGLNVSGQGGSWLVTRCLYHADGYGTYLAGQRISSAGVVLDPTPIMLMDWVYGGTVSVVGPSEYLVAGPDWNDGSVIKARRVSVSGQPVGGSFTIPSLTIAGSGSEYYVAWVKDYVNLVGSRMSAAGVLSTPAGTTLVSNFSQYVSSTLGHDGAQWWLAWGAGADLRTVRVNAGGTVLDPNGGVHLPITIGGTIDTAYNPKLIARVGGGVQVMWYDQRVALNYDSNVFGLSVSGANVPGVERLISTGSHNQRNAAITAGPGGTSAVAYVSEAAGEDRVLVQLLDNSGVAIGAGPIEVARAAGVGLAGIAWNGSVYMVAWDGGAGSAAGIKARRMNPNGTFVDASPLSIMPGFNASVGALGGDFLVAGARFGAYAQTIGLHGNRVNGGTGALLDGPNGMNLSGAVGSGYVTGLPRVRSDGSQWLVAAGSQWTHDSSQGDAILAKVPPVGLPTAAFNPTPFSGSSGDLDIAYSGSKYLLVWRMNSLANANNYVAGRIMNADGTFPGGWFVIAEATGRQLRPTVAWDGTSFVVAWDDQRNQGAFFDARTDVYAARVSEDGVVLDTIGFPAEFGSRGECSPAMLPVASGTCLVATTRFVQGAGLDSYRIGLSSIGDLACGVVITGQPGASRACLGGEARFTVSAEGAVTYAWRKDGAFIDPVSNPTAVSPTLVLTGVSVAAAGQYDCSVSKACGSVVSQAASLSVCAADRNCDGEVDLVDFFDFLTCFDQGLACADITDDAEINLGDFFAFFNAFDQSC